MKVTPTYSPLTVATLMAGLLTASIGINTISATSLPGNAKSAAPLIAMDNTTALAKELQGKPVVVDIYASWCGNCRNIAPTLAQLKQQYGKKANFVVFDVTDRQTTMAAKKTAARLGLSDFFNANKAQTSTVAIIDPGTGKVTKLFRNNDDLVAYTNVLNRSIAKMGKTSAMRKP
jgi:thiol-disulfide isomerase/thioredoxin